MPTLTEPENPLRRLTPEQLEELGRELDELHEEVKDDLGERDATYIRSIIALHRRLGLIGRAALVGSRSKPAWVAGTATLSVAKILENMEIGHNVLHGQWDWMNDPVINSAAWDWDTASTAEAWKHSHNYIHHTYTNIRGKDKDLGYEIMRIDPHQPWHPVYLLQPLYNLLLMAFFEWGVAFHDLDLDAVRSGEKDGKEVAKELRGIWGKARGQIVKDYVAWPLLSAGRRRVRVGRALARAQPAAARRAAHAPRAARRPRGERAAQARPAPRRRTTARARCAPRATRSSPPRGPTSRRTSSATCGRTRSSSAATSPTRRTPSPRRRPRTRRAARATCAS